MAFTCAASALLQGGDTNLLLRAGTWENVTDVRKIFVALLGKQLAVRPRGWRAAAGGR